MNNDTQKPPRRFDNLRERLHTPLPGETAASVDPRYAKRLPEFRPQASAGTAPSASAPAKPKAVAPVVPTMTPAQAFAKGVQDGRERHAAVMASDAAKGRERQANDLLIASCNRSAELKTASAIIAKLATCPTDAQLAAVDKHLKSVAAQKVWAKAYGVAPSVNANSAGQGPWDKAQAILTAQRGTPCEPNAKASTILADQRAHTGKKAGERTPGDVWENAYNQPRLIPGF